MVLVFILFYSNFSQGKEVENFILPKRRISGMNRYD